jgi:hypothetical protein
LTVFFGMPNLAPILSNAEDWVSYPSSKCGCPDCAKNRQTVYKAVFEAVGKTGSAMECP